MSAILNAKHGNHVVAGLLAPDEVPAPSPSTASKAMPLQEEARAGDDKPSKAAAALSKPASAEEARKVHMQTSNRFFDKFVLTTSQTYTNHIKVIHPSWGG